MGKVVSTQVGDRSAQEFGRNPYAQTQDVQVATVSEGGAGTEHYPTATAIEETGGGFGQTATATAVPPRGTATTPTTVWGERVGAGSGTGTAWNSGGAAGGNRTGTAGWNTGGATGGNSGEGFQGLFTLLFFGVCIGVPIAITSGVFDGESSTPSPTPFPSNPPSSVVVCPTVFDASNRNEVVASCGLVGCGGSIEWCGLNDATSYRLIVSVKGDYDAASESVTINFGGFAEVGSADVQCGSSFVEIFNQVATPSAGTHLMTYQNSNGVNSICSSGSSSFAMEMNATLIQL